MLATAGGHPVGVDSLIDAIWTDDPPETGHQAASVADALAEHEVLLVLDNGEHVAAACRELVTAVLARAPA